MMYEQFLEIVDKKRGRPGRFSAQYLVLYKPQTNINIKIRNLSAQHYLLMNCEKNVLIFKYDLEKSYRKR